MKSLFYLRIYMYKVFFYPRAWGVWTQPAMSYTVLLDRVAITKFI